MKQFAKLKLISLVRSLPQEVPAESHVDGDDLAVVVLHHLAHHAPPADDELAAGGGPEVDQAVHRQVGQAVVVLRDEEAHVAVLPPEGIVLSDVVKPAGELCHVDSLEMERVVRSRVGLTRMQGLQVR